MWWYAYGWWWYWWFGFLIIFFLLPLGYGWGYRGWGPWYRRRRRPGPNRVTSPDRTDRLEPVDTGWGWLGIALWIALIIAIIWAFGGWGWGRR